MSDATVNQQPESTTEYTLKKAHEHGGDNLKQGDKVQLTESEAQFCKQRGII